MYGAALLKRGTTIFDELRESVRDIEFLADPAAGEVRIGCHHFLATGFVSAVIDRLSRRHPRIVIHIVASETATLHRELNDRNVDLLVAWRALLQTHEQASNFSLMTPLSSRRARDIRGCVGAGSSLPSWRAKHGHCHRRKACLGRSEYNPFAPKDSTILARLCSAFPPRC